MIDGFEQSFVQCGAVRLAVHRGGAGAPLILLHGYPQNHMTWAKVAPAFAQDFDVIIPDLRGYGDSDAPVDTPAHSGYSKRQMASDIVHLMDQLGLQSAHILGHDRGARVAYRFALDHPERLRKLGIIEIVPTCDFWDGWDHARAMKAYHWTFLAQPAPLPERMIAGDPEAYAKWTLQSWTKDKTLDAFAPDALASYVAQMSDPHRVAAMCADYRAGASYDDALDRADRAAGRKISNRMHFLCGAHGFPAQTGDPDGLWRDWARDLTTSLCDAGHFAMEENPTAVTQAFIPFFTGR